MPDHGAADHDLLHPVGVRDLVHQRERPLGDERSTEVVGVDPVDERDVGRKGRARVPGRRHRDCARGAAAAAARLVEDGDMAGVAPAELDTAEVEGAHAERFAGAGKKGSDRAVSRYSRQVCPHLTQRKNRTSDSSADLSWRIHQNARLCSHSGHFVAIVGLVEISSASSKNAISFSCRTRVRFIWSSSVIWRIYPQRRHLSWPALEIIMLLHCGQNIVQLFESRQD